jgi:hypothetical protein
VDIIISDTTKTITHEYIYQVISSNDCKIHYLIIRSKITTCPYIICRYNEDLHIPRVKMRD